MTEAQSQTLSLILEELRLIHRAMTGQRPPVDSPEPTAEAESPSQSK